MQKQQIVKYIIATEELAAEYAGVDAETIQQWVKNGMPMTEAGEYLKPWLDLYLQTNGNPTEQDRQSTLAEYPELSITRPKKATTDNATNNTGVAEAGDTGIAGAAGLRFIEPPKQRLRDNNIGPGAAETNR